ncbi:MAG: response regulator [Limisphaerales bacterium]
METRVFVLVGERSVEEAQVFNLALLKLRDIRFHIVLDGNEVIEYLQAKGKYRDRLAYPFPSWLVLNFDMPVRSALDIMRWLRKNPKCNVVPVILLSDNSTPGQVRTAYELGANSVFKKPQSVDEMSEGIEALDRYWRLSQLPIQDPNFKCE